MNHLTTSQILQTVDGTADYATQAAVSSHLAVCPECRKEMEFQKALLRNARRTPLPPVSDRFTRRVMSRVDPRGQGVVSGWLLNNMGSLFALMAVLGTFWLVLSQPISLSVDTSQAESQGDRIVEQWRQGVSDSYAWMNEMLKAAASKPVTDRTGSTSGGNPEKLVLIVLSLGVLVAIDRLWLSRHRIRPKN